MTPEETPKDSMPTPPPADKGSGETPPEKPNKSRPVKVYLIALFCVALLLLLVSFVMQQRNHLALQDLNDSISNNQAVADLQLENQRLQYELEEPEEPGGGPAKPGGGKGQAGPGHGVAAAD